MQYSEVGDKLILSMYAFIDLNNSGLKDIFWGKIYIFL